ncbi:ead/Ea22-like family protein, partial [Escherichia coli]|nr:ead/Ea22-like family protein [Escherichia coli]
QELREAAEQATQDEWVAYILPGHNGFILRARLRVGIADTLLTGLASVRGGRAST